MIPVVITNYVLQKIRAEMNVPYEQIGLLIGELTNGQLMITEAISGTSSATRSLSILSTEVLAEVADDIINNRISGRIVGWYHSHPGHGLFLSQTDLDTHMQFYQFSPYAISLVADPRSSEFGIWIYENGAGVVQLPANYIHII